VLLLRRYVVDQPSSDALLAWLKPYEDFVYRKIGNGGFSGYASLSKKLISKSDFENGDELISKMVLLIKEELHHFKQVWQIMQSRGVTYDNITASRYARGMMKSLRTYEPSKLSDNLIYGAYIEARSCEHLAKLAPHLDDELNQFYVSLLRSEARHFQNYLFLATNVSATSIDERVVFFGEKEAKLI
jgi:tRNA-(ms[2]io[6]A)-hydroxylase